MIGLNGGLLGAQRSTNTSTAPGLWTANEQALLKRASAWPLSGDPYLAYNSLLLHMDGSNNSTTFTDSGPGAVAVTALGNAKVSTTQSKFGGASGAFDGSGDYLTCTLAAFGTNDFTIETWARMSSYATYRMLYESRTSDGDGSGFVLGVNSIGQLFMYLAGFNLISTDILPLNTWVHVALTRAGSAWRVFVNGTVQSGSYSNAGNLTRTAVRIGMDWSSTGYAMDGYLDDYRITNGIARYTANFTPPTGPFLDVGTGGDPYFPTTSLLLHMDGSNGSTTFTDSSTNALSVTANGNAQISTAQSKFGGASGLFDGSGDFLTLPASSLFAFGTSDFTVETWIRPTSYPITYNTIASTRNTSGVTTGWSLSVVSDGTLILYTTGFTYSGTVTGAVTLNTWNHVAIVRSSNSFQAYVNGVANKTGAVSVANNFTDQTFWVGAVNGLEPFTGYIDDLRVTKGIARYTANFTPPTAPFPNA
jgi:hypothetical protein